MTRIPTDREMIVVTLVCCALVAGGLWLLWGLG